MNFVKKYLPPIAIILISCAVYKDWLTFKVYSFGDYIYYFKETLSSFFPLSIWRSGTGMGDVDILIWRTPQNILYGLFGQWGFDLNVADRFIIFWPWLILSGLSIYFLLNYILNSRKAAFIGSIVFCFNTYFLSISSQGHLLLAIAASLGVFSLLFFIKTLNERKILYGIVSGFSLFLSASYDLRMAYIVVGLIIGYSIFGFFTEKMRLAAYLKRNIYMAIVPAAIFISLSIYWVMSLATSSSFTENAVLSRTLFGNEFLNIVYAITLFHPFWTGGQPAWFAVQSIPIYFWLVPILSFLGLLLKRDNKYVLFFGVVALAGIFLTKQVAAPFSWVYPLFYKYLPGFDAFREASKFYFLIALGYSVLIAGFVKWLLSVKKSRKLLYLMRYPLIIAVCFLFLWNTKPIITGEIGSLFVEKTIPKDYDLLRNLLGSEKEYYRTLWVPRSARWFLYTNNRPEVSGVLALNSIWKEFAYKKDFDDSVTEGEVLGELLKQKDSDKLLDLSSIKYVILPVEDRGTDDVFLYYGKDRKYFKDVLEHIPYLQKKDIGASELEVFENKNYRPHLYLTPKIDSLKSDESVGSVASVLDNPSQYHFSIKSLTHPVYLYFSESYHPQWKIRIGDDNWLGALFDPHYFLPDTVHAKTDVGLNSFYLDPVTICKTSASCIKNSDGSYDLNGVLYFKPQSYFYLGGIFSIASFIVVVSFGLYFVIKRKYEK